MTIWLVASQDMLLRSRVSNRQTHRYTNSTSLGRAKKYGGISSSARRRIWQRLPEHWPAESMDCARTVCEWEDLKSKANEMKEYHDGLGVCSRYIKLKALKSLKHACIILFKVSGTPERHVNNETSDKNNNTKNK